MMRSNTEAVTFENRTGHRLFGTVHRPVDSPGNQYPTIVLLSPGVKMRVGPHRLYSRLTEMLVSLGFTVFKFDFFGLGDSEGELDREHLMEVYNDTESGLFVDDAVDALDWLCATTGEETFLLGGLCGGAITSILAASNDPRVLGLICLGPTVTMSMPPEQRMKYASSGELSALRGAYTRKLLDPKSWARLLSLKSDFGTIRRTIGQALRRKSRPKSKSRPSEPEPSSNANPRFPTAFFSIVESGRKMLLVFSQADKAYWDFQEKFVEKYSDKLAPVHDSYEIHVIENANHVFTFREWEYAMHGYVGEWLKENYCGSHNP